MTETVMVAIVGSIGGLLTLVITIGGKIMLRRQDLALKMAERAWQQAATAAKVSSEQLYETRQQSRVQQEQHYQNTEKLEKVAWLVNGNNEALQRALTEAYAKITWQEHKLREAGLDPIELEEQRLALQRKLDAAKAAKAGTSKDLDV